MAQQTAQVAEGLPLPQVRLEMRHGGRQTSYPLDHVDFLIGAVPGCDLRLPGADLPPVICALARHPRGLAFRKLAPTQLVLLNGQTANHTDLADGDRITIGALDLIVHMESSPASARTDQDSSGRGDLRKQAEQLRGQVIRFQEERQAFDQFQARRQAELDEQARQVEAARADLERPGSNPDPEPPVSDLGRRVAELERARQELASQRQELADIRKQLYDRYQERRDRLATLQTNVDHAAKKVQQRKAQVDEQVQQIDRRQQALEKDQAELARRARELTDASVQLEQERQTFHDSLASVRHDLEARQANLREQEAQLHQEQAAWQDRLRGYEANVLRLDRREGELEEREAKLAQRGQDVEEKLARLQNDSAELEQQALQLDELKIQLEEQAERMGRQREEQDALGLQLGQRSASLEGQQATLAALRARLERTREDYQRHQQQLDEQRQRQDLAASQLEQESQALLNLKTELDNEQKLRDHERQSLGQRQATLEAAVANLRQAQEAIADQELALRQRLQELERRELGLVEQEGNLQGRLNQVGETQERLDAERQALRERTLALAQAEQAREALQEQLRKRSEDLAVRHKEWQEKFASVDAQKAELVSLREDLAAAQLQAQAEAEERLRTLQAQENSLRAEQQNLKQIDADLEAAKTELAQAREHFAAEQEAFRRASEAKAQELAQAQGEWQAMRRQADALAQQLPELELRAGAALDRLSHAREQLRDHLGEAHAFVRQGQEEMNDQRLHLQAAAQQLREQEQDVRLRQEEHRLALAAFRQQLIAWQGNITDLKRTLARGENRLERQQAQVDQESRRLDEASAHLARQAEQLEARQQEVAVHRQEMDRHLLEMREWYRRKLRDLAGLELASGPAAQPAENNSASQTVPGRNILSMTEPTSPADLALGEMLRNHDLVDAPTLTALLAEGRRQRRTLRQVLLASGAVTLYQLALIEAGNLDGLMIGPVRVLDRLRTTAHETVYRVFDPRRGHEAVLRHLAEEDANDAVHPDEFRQRFQSLLANDPHRSGTLEVMEACGRPAVLQEWLVGLPASDWPPLVAAPGVCYRLLTQTALGLAQAHQRGLFHGRLDEGALLLTAEGIVKIRGLGEPSWLNGGGDGQPDAEGDLRALGKLAGAWCSTAGVRKGSKAKPLPEALANILNRLENNGYSEVAQLIADLEGASDDVPANAEAWDRLIKYVRDHGAPEATLRQTA